MLTKALIIFRVDFTNVIYDEQSKIAGETINEYEKSDFKNQELRVNSFMTIIINFMPRNPEKRTSPSIIHREKNSATRRQKSEDDSKCN